MLINRILAFNTADRNDSALFREQAMNDIPAKLHKLKQQIQLLAAASDRNPTEIGLLAVSKTFSARHVRVAYDAGQRSFGENYIDEALDKIKTLAGLNIDWHFIGAIQSNKTRKIAENFSWAHTVASEKVAHRLHRQRPADLPPLNICIQVNISHEPGKAGTSAEQAIELADQIHALPHLRLRGIMGIPEKTTDQKKQRQSFHALTQVFQQIQDTGIPVDTLSMGMSADMAAAIAEGATLLRIGTAIFGQRTHKHDKLFNMNTPEQQKIGFIGAGNMAGSLVAGLLNGEHDKTCIKISEPNTTNRNNMAHLGVEALPDNQALAQWADTLVLAVKPQTMKTVIKDIAAVTEPDQPLIISIAAGISIASITRWLGQAAAVIRVMPNTPAQVGHGMSALFANENASESQKRGAQAILQSVGDILWLEHEKQMDLVTAISGSGPAYFFLLMETLIKAAGESGMDEAMAKKLVLQTALGAAVMAAESDLNPEELRKQVTSPGGTTEKAIEVFLNGQLAGLSREAIKAAANRSAELSTELGEKS